MRRSYTRGLQICGYSTKEDDRVVAEDGGFTRDNGKSGNWSTIITGF